MMPLPSNAAAESTNWAVLARRTRRRRWLAVAALYGFLIVTSLPVLIPYFWMLTISVSATSGRTETFVLWRALIILSLAVLAVCILRSLGQRKRAIRSGAVAIGAVALGALAIFVGPYLHLGNYAFLWNPNMVEDLRGYAGAHIQQFPSVWIAFKNSLLFALTMTVGVIVVATPAGYYISRFNFSGRSSVLRILLVLHAFPILTLIVPIFLILRFFSTATGELLGLDSILTVALVRLTLELPFSIFIMKGFFDSVPWEIEMSAMTDGVSRRRAFIEVVLPQVTGGIIAIGIFAFIRGWEEYIFVFTMIFEKANWVMSLFLFFVADDVMGVDYGIVAAVGVFYILPALLLYVFLQKYLVQLTIGGIKG